MHMERNTVKTKVCCAHLNVSIRKIGVHMETFKCAQRTFIFTVKDVFATVLHVNLMIADLLGVDITLIRRGISDGNDSHVSS